MSWNRQLMPRAYYERKLVDIRQAHEHATQKYNEGADFAKPESRWLWGEERKRLAHEYKETSDKMGRAA
jgi:hypothetical protein